MQIPEIEQVAASPQFRADLVELLVAMCAIDTTPNADVGALRQAEAAVFDLLERRFAACGLDHASAERRPIDPKIAEHPFFSQLYYTQTAERPDGLSSAACYAGRSNLVLCVDGDGGRDAGINQAVNAHVDVVSPYLPPRVEGDTVFGRGACDDKGCVAAIMGALMLVGAYLRARGVRLNRDLICMLVIEEEMGGNGSLSAALDEDLKQRYDSLVVLEVCGNRLYPGNRGALWYKVEADLSGNQGALPGGVFEAAAYVIEQLEKEGRSIRAESRHELFPHRPVQTCHGIIGHCGEHPSAINGEVAFDIGFDDNADPALALPDITDVIGFALDEYIGFYGDKTKVTDPGTGKPKVDHHFDLVPSSNGYTVTVWGSAGHMGSILENDGAITKMMTLVRALIRSRARLARAAGGDVCFRQHGWAEPQRLLLEGGQGFLPTHEMDEVQTRLREAVQRGADEYFRLMGLDIRAADHFVVTFDKLHNAAFAGAPDSPDMLNGIACAKAAGIWDEQDYAEGIRGWDVSCDARIFACQYPDMPVITTGPGLLRHAHSEQEQINIPEMIGSARFLAYYILKQTGTIG